ncbi:MAG TPA: hypothetical protein VF131_01665 [Blastocatellia bacterium]|nr:hypothetical protein [Blastocatellia bacterium]
MTSPLDELKVDQQSPLSPLLSGWRVPSLVKVEQDHLIYSVRDRSVSLNPLKPFQVLEDFLGLEGASDDHIVIFAKRWGVLGICEHGLPASHNSMYIPFDGPLAQEILQKGYRDTCLPVRNSGDMGYEPLEAWRFWIQQANTIIRLAADLHSNRRGDIKYWQILRYNPHHFEGFLGNNKTPSNPPPVVLGRIILASYLNGWLQLTGVQPFFYWEGHQTFLRLASWTTDQLLSVLGTQMMLMINRSSGYALCSSCGRPFFLRRGQGISRNVYCDAANCGRKAANRLAQVRFHLRNAENPLRRKRDRTRLTEQQVKAIKNKCQKYKGDSYPPGFIQELANQNGVSKSLVYKIAQGKIRSTIK